MTAEILSAIVIIQLITQVCCSSAGTVARWCNNEETHRFTQVSSMVPGRVGDIMLPGRFHKQDSASSYGPKT